MKSRGRKNSILQNEKGLATIETLPLLVIFLVLTGYSFGVYGVIQSSILNSIGARAYAFETFRNRANLTYFRSNNIPTPYESRFNTYGSRLHAVTSEFQDGTSIFHATERPLSMGLGSTPAGDDDSPNFHNQILPGLYKPGSVDQGRYSQGAAPVWIKISYGICVTAKCEPEG